ncbi:ParA family protein [Kocuria atrinae]|uniref:ParA family protein n=1 Tax=Kocuria atrinae TaxID=592377 RepID=UPI0002E0A3DE|nr:ParA family protein [Kocuria atrinae]
MQIVSISSLKGGVGKSSVTLGLASAALEAGIPTLVIDLDPHADASTALGVRAQPSRDIGSILRKPKKGAVSKITVPSSWTEHPITPETSTSADTSTSPAPTSGDDAAPAEGASGHKPGDNTQPHSPARPVLDIAPGSAASSHLDRSTFKVKDLKGLETVLQSVDKYELVLIDCPPSLTALTRMAWAASHKVLSVAEPSLFSVAGTKRTMTAIAQFEVSKLWAVPAAGVIVNRAREDFSEHSHRIAELEELFGELVVQPTLPDAPVMQQIQGAAWPVHKWPGDQATDLAARFTTILNGLLK